MSSPPLLQIGTLSFISVDDTLFMFMIFIATCNPVGMCSPSLTCNKFNATMRWFKLQTLAPVEML